MQKFIAYNSEHLAFQYLLLSNAFILKSNFAIFIEATFLSPKLCFVWPHDSRRLRTPILILVKKSPPRSLGFICRFMRWRGGLHRKRSITRGDRRAGRDCKLSVHFDALPWESALAIVVVCDWPKITIADTTAWTETLLQSHFVDFFSWQMIMMLLIVPSMKSFSRES